MWNPSFWAGVCCSQGFTAVYWPFECWEDGSVFRKLLISSTCASLKISASLLAVMGSFFGHAHFMPWPVQDMIFTAFSRSWRAALQFRGVLSAQGWACWLRFSTWSWASEQFLCWYCILGCEQCWSQCHLFLLFPLTESWWLHFLPVIHGNCNAEDTGGAAPPQLFCVRWAAIEMGRKITCRMPEGPLLFEGLLYSVCIGVTSFLWGMSSASQFWRMLKVSELRFWPVWDSTASVLNQMWNAKLT